MSNRFNPFNNPKPAIYFILGFILLVAFFLAKESRAETDIEWGATFAGGKYTHGSALFFSETWDDKYLIGFGLVGDQHRIFNTWGIVPGRAVPTKITVKSNMMVQAQRLVTYKKVTLGIGVAKWQHTSRIFGDTFTFALSLSYEINNSWDFRYRHFSNGGTASPNSGQDILLIGYRFGK